MIPLFFASVAPAEERILEYRSRVAIAPDSVLTVREDITVTVEHRNIIRGIYRDYPTDYKDARRASAVRVGFRVTEALLDGAAVPWKTEKHGNGTRLHRRFRIPRAEGKTHLLPDLRDDEADRLFRGSRRTLLECDRKRVGLSDRQVRFSSLPGDPDTKRLATDFFTGSAGERGKEARVTSEGEIVTTGVLSERDSRFLSAGRKGS